METPLLRVSDGLATETLWPWQAKKERYVGSQEHRAEPYVIMSRCSIILLGREKTEISQSVYVP